jgi:type II secretory pathway component PulF
LPVYDYKGLTPSGEAKAGIVDADSPREARIKLRGQNVLVTDITAREASVRRDRRAPKATFQSGAR